MNNDIAIDRELGTWIPDRGKVIKWLEYDYLPRAGAYRKDCKQGCDACMPMHDGNDYCDIDMLCKVLAMLKEHKVRELTMDEWREWKNNQKRNPICKLWEHDTSPMWILNPNDIHEPALLMGKLKLFTGKPTFEECKAVKWK